MLQNMILTIYDEKCFDQNLFKGKRIYFIFLREKQKKL